MSNEAVGEFFKSVYEDKSLQGALNYALVAASPETVVEIAKEKGYDISVEDLKSMLNESSAELSEAELESVAGGFSLNSGLLGRQALQVNFWNRFSPGGGFGNILNSGGAFVQTNGPDFVQRV